MREMGLVGGRTHFVDRRWRVDSTGSWQEEEERALLELVPPGSEGRGETMPLEVGGLERGCWGSGEGRVA